MDRKVLDLVNYFDVVVFNHTYREVNVIADCLVNLGVDGTKFKNLGMDV